MTDLLWFLALALVIAGVTWLAFLSALKGAPPDPNEYEETDPVVVTASRNGDQSRRNGLVVSDVEMTFEPLTTEEIADRERAWQAAAIPDISGTIRGTIDFVDPEAIERIREEEARRIRRMLDNGPTG